MNGSEKGFLDPLLTFLPALYTSCETLRIARGAGRLPSLAGLVTYLKEGSLVFGAMRIECGVVRQGRCSPDRRP